MFPKTVFCSHSKTNLAIVPRVFKFVLRVLDLVVLENKYFMASWPLSKRGTMKLQVYKYQRIKLICHLQKLICHLQLGVFSSRCSLRINQTKNVHYL